MDLIKIGKFLAKLRREKNYTQEELGERIGVTNKTISRWENGNYLPGVDMLQILSREFSVSINELLCGERLDEADYRENAEKVILSVLEKSPFSLKEKCSFFQKKWKKDHLAARLLSVMLVLGIMAFGIFTEKYYISGIGVLVGAALYLILYNRMMAYVEKNAYDGSGGR